MSKTVPVEYNGFPFWVFDMSAALLWASMIDIATADAQPNWFAEIVDELRVNAAIGEGTVRC